MQSHEGYQDHLNYRQDPYRREGFEFQKKVIERVQEFTTLTRPTSR